MNARTEETVISQLPEDLLHKRNSDILQVQSLDNFQTYFEYESGLFLINVHNRLKHSISYRKSINTLDFILDIINSSYKIPFINEPESVFLKNNKSAFDNSDFVGKAIQDLLDSNQGGVERTFCVNPLTVFVSQSGKGRLILDLRHVNKQVVRPLIKHWRKDGIKITVYLDDGLALAEEEQIVDKDVAPLGAFYVLITLDCLKDCWTMYVFRDHWTICLSVTGRTSSKMCYLLALCNIEIITKIFSTRFWSANENVAHPELRLLLHNLPTTVTDAKAKSTLDKYSGVFKRFAKWTEKYHEITCILPCKEIYVGLYLPNLIESANHFSLIESAFYSIRWAHNLAGVKTLATQI
ncbi:unnamed protein product [Mytilus edulis]|uniref:Uncharacterized protein n=1 Tax=Mytilus edulis TaxID=6550 RepID=A0A8S3URH8_MYTED|nr:unnamed protein product [Mytilus edulis]